MVTGIEKGEESKIEGRRRTGGHRDAARIDGDLVAQPVMAGDRLTQFAQAERIGITDPPVFQRGLSGFERRFRRGMGGLADRHGNDGASRLPAPVRFRQNIHGVKGFDCAPLRHRDQGHALS
ncbi:hypothetical protein D3C86_1346570 [compost metagenome]